MWFQPSMLTRAFLSPAVGARSMSLPILFNAMCKFLLRKKRLMNYPQSSNKTLLRRIFMNLDDFIITCFCWIDDGMSMLTLPQRLRQRGPMPKLSDSEVLTMEVV